MNVFLLTAPYQLIAAREAATRFGLANNVLCIVDIGSFDPALFTHVARPNEWTRILRVPLKDLYPDRDFGLRPPDNPWDRLREMHRTLHGVIKRIRVERLAARLGEADTLVLGGYLPGNDAYLRHFANHCHFGRLVVLDAGTDALRSAQARLDERMPSPIPCHRPDEGVPQARSRTFRGALRRRFVELDERGAPKILFFTAYDLPHRPPDEVVKHAFPALREKIAAMETSREVLFVGQPLVDQRYLTAEVFTALMRDVRRHFEGEPVAYMAHPRESRAQLGLVERAGFRVESEPIPFELLISTRDRLPRCIATFFSSVIPNCHALLRDSVQLIAFRVPEEHLLKDVAEVASVYGAFAALGPPLVEILSARAASGSEKLGVSA